MSSFFFNDTATTEIYTLSLHDALPISAHSSHTCTSSATLHSLPRLHHLKKRDRKSTRLNSSHQIISYAVFCLKKKTRVSAGGHAGPVPAPGAPTAQRPHPPGTLRRARA